MVKYCYKIIKRRSNKHVVLTYVSSKFFQCSYRSIFNSLTFQQSLSMSSKSKSLHPHPLFIHLALHEDVWILEEKYFINFLESCKHIIRVAAADLLIDTGKEGLK